MGFNMPKENTSQEAIDMVNNYLNAMEDRDFKIAKSYLHKNFKLVFPGDRVFLNIEDLTKWAKLRYRWVKKNYEHFDPLSSDDNIIVYCYGTLYGEWLDKTKFSGVRFIDRFILKDQKILNQMVWNDMAEYIKA